MSQLGAEVVGADAALANIKVAKIHALKSGLLIDYRKTTTQALLDNEERFDVVLNMEVIEHVLVPETFIDECACLLRSGGLMFCSTINRNRKSYLMAIIGAERIMRWLPVGTHDWKKFITPNELQQMIQSAGLNQKETRGFIFNPFKWEWSISTSNFSVNYVMTGEKS
jgi:2-polyprenyl-6-hydroxyphenyl methylase/3-demethylubiquinone-9 3-methyltransferase